MTDRKGLLRLLVLVSAQFIVMLDSSIVNVALPSISANLQLTTVGSAWVLNAYFLTFGGLLLVSGRAADIFGRRKMLLAGSAVFIIASLIGGFATAEPILIVARLMQGAGAAIVSPTALSILLVLFAGPERAKAISIWGAASAMAGATGVSLGGVITAGLGWQWVFHLAAAAAVVTLAGGALTLPKDTTQTRRPFDIVGAALITAAALTVVWAVLSIGQDRALSLPGIGGIIGAVILIGLFVAHERRAPDPILPLTVLRNVSVSAGVAVNFLGGAARIACFFLVALFLQQELHYAPGLAGLAMLPTSAAGFLVTLLLLPKLVKRFGPERTAVSGLVLLAVAHGYLALAPTDARYPMHVLPALLIAAAGVALSFTPTTLVITKGIPVENAGVGSGLASCSAQLGGAVGIALFIAIEALVTTGTPAGPVVAGSIGTGFSASFLAAAITAASAAALGFIALVRRPGTLHVVSPARDAADEEKPEQSSTLKTRI